MFKKKLKYLLFFIFGSISETIVLPFFILSAILAKIVQNKSAIFMGMMHINNWTYVAEAMRQKGYYVQVVPWMIPEHEIDVIPYDVNLSREYPRLYSNFIGQYFLSYFLFVWALFKFGIFVMPFRNRLLDRTVWLKWFEIPLIQLAGKKVILNTFGGDVATPRIKRRKDLKYSLYDGYATDPQYQAYNEHAIARNTWILEKQANCIISAIDHVDYLNRVDEYFHLRCIDTLKIQPSIKVNNAVPVFVHAPNHRAIKGTDTIIAVIESLNKRGIHCDLQIIENTSNSKLLDIIRNADAVIDQLLLGTYARLAIEAMALSKPVFCYLRQDLYPFNPIWKECPIINVNPETLESHLESFLMSPKEKQQEIGKKGRQYIERYHSLEFVGQRFDNIIQKVLIQ